MALIESVAQMIWKLLKTKNKNVSLCLRDSSQVTRVHAGTAERRAKHLIYVSV